MRFILERVADPEIEPVTLAEMKLHLRVTHTEEDAAITELITESREWVEDFTGRALIDQSWRLTIEQRPVLSGDSVGGLVQPGYYCGRFQWERVGEIMLRKAPVLAISSFVTVDAAGTETAVAADTYQLREANSKWPRLVALSGATWGTENFRITIRAGFADRTGSPQQTAEEVPPRFKRAMKMWAEAMYERDPALIEVAKNIIRYERSNLGFA